MIVVIPATCSDNEALGGTRESTTMSAEITFGLIFIADQLQRLVPRDDTQRSLKTQATTLVMEFGQLRSMLTAQSVASISRQMLIVVICWLMFIFLSFSLLAPSNPTATVALIASTLSVAGAIFLILEMDLPFEGMIRISSEPMLRVISHLAK